MSTERPALDRERVDPETRLLSILNRSQGDGAALAAEWLALPMGRTPLPEWLPRRLAPVPSLSDGLGAPALDHCASTSKSSPAPSPVSSGGHEAAVVADLRKRGRAHLGAVESFLRRAPDDARLAGERHVLLWLLGVVESDPPVSVSGGDEEARCRFCDNTGSAAVEGYFGTDDWHGRIVPCDEPGCAFRPTPPVPEGGDGAVWGVVRELTGSLGWAVVGDVPGEESPVRIEGYWNDEADARAFAANLNRLPAPAPSGDGDARGQHLRTMAAVLQGDARALALGEHETDSGAALLRSRGRMCDDLADYIGAPGERFKFNADLPQPAAHLYDSPPSGDMARLRDQIAHMFAWSGTNGKAIARADVLRAIDALSASSDTPEGDDQHEAS